MCIVEQQCSGFDVVLLGGDVQGWEVNLSTGVVFQQQSNDLVVTLLQCDRQRCKPVLSQAHKPQRVGCFHVTDTRRQTDLTKVEHYVTQRATKIEFLN